jgi:hypothetical protein
MRMMTRKRYLVAVLLLLLGAGLGTWLGEAAGATASAGSEGLPEGQSFAFLGYVKDGSNTLGIIETLGLVFLVREGDTILGTYRVKQLGEDFALLQEGEREIRAAARPPQPALPERQDELRSGRRTARSDVPDPSSSGDTPGDASSSGRPADQGIGLTASGGAQAGGVPGALTPAADPSQAVPPADNPFLRAVQAAREGRQSPAPSDENPFARALRERSSVQPSPEDNPFLRALRERAVQQ